MRACFVWASDVGLVGIIVGKLWVLTPLREGVLCHFCKQDLLGMCLNARTESEACHHTALQTSK